MMKNVYSVGQINSYIANLFSQDFMLNRISVKGEISNCKYHSSGHIYFTLKDKTGILNAVMFSGARQKGLKFRMQEGDKVIVDGSVRVYERDGKYQLYAEQIRLEGTGDLYQQFELLKKELEEMGMFSQEYKQPIPKYAKTIGIVTASTGAAIRDIQNIAHRRNPCVQLILFPAKVQGDGAAESIVSGIHALESRNVDIIIVGRGGGSLEDLWAFNEEIVARAIFECSVPIISAVGHETDFTIADFVADLRAPTPSAAAELAVNDLKLILDDLAVKKQMLRERLEYVLEKKRRFLEQEKLRLDVHHPIRQLEQKRQWTISMEERLSYQMERVFQRDLHRLEVASTVLDGLSPLKKLSGGYAYISNGDGKRVHSVKDVEIGAKMHAYLLDGCITSKVTKVTNKEN